MVTDARLEEAKVYHQLDWRWSWHGLTAHVLVGLVPGMAAPTLVAGFVDEVTLWPYVLLAVASTVVLCTLQYGRDPNYFKRQMAAFATRRHLSPFRPESFKEPFVATREALACPPA